MTTTMFTIVRLMLLLSVGSLTVRGEDSDHPSDEFGDESESAFAPKDAGYTSYIDFSPSSKQPEYGLLSAESRSRHNQALAKYQLSGQPSNENVYTAESFNHRPRSNNDFSNRFRTAPKFEKLVTNPHNFDYQTKHQPSYKVNQNNGLSILEELRQNPDVAAYFKPSSSNYEIKHPAKYKIYVDDAFQEGPKSKSGKLRYLPGVHEANSRIRRYAGGGKRRRARRQSDEEDDPYDYRSDYASRPKVFDSPAYSSYTDGRKNYDDAEEDPYNYGSDAGYDFKEYERIKSLSEAQAAEVKRNPENCKEEARDGMTCHVCKDPKTGGNFESCSYVSAPKNNKYAYSKEKKFDSNDQPEEGEGENKSAKLQADETTESTVEETTPYTKQAYTAPKTTYSPPVYKSSYKSSSSSPTGSYAKLTSADPSKSSYQEYKSDPNDEIEEIPYKGYSRPKSQSIRASHDEEDESSSNESDEEQPKHGYSKPYDYKAAIPGFYTDNEEKKDVEHVLAEFKKKDRSSCNKVNKNGMTCYQCIDKTGLKHEECMFVSESQPKKSHLAYQESKEYTSKPPTLNDDEGSESQIVSTSKSVDYSDPYGSKLKRKKVASESLTSTVPTLIPPVGSLPLQNVPTATSATYSVSRRHPAKRVVKRSKEAEVDPNPTIPEESNIAPPEEFAGTDSKGAFWAELEPRYSKTLGVSLPAFMLERSEHEMAFDDSVSG